jgi:hypothetical protein
MKYLKKYSLFERFSLENKVFETYNRFGSRTITESEFDKIRKENCKNWTKAKTEIFRGMPNLGDYVIVDPKMGDPRLSIEDTNIHLELMSNLPSWKDYPKYDRCVIGGTPGSATGTYGETVYEVVPFDGIKIGVCPYATIWESFGNEDSEWGGDIYLVRNFLDAIDLEVGWIQIDGETLENKLKSINEFDLKLISVDNFITDCSLVLDKRKEDINGVDCYDFINEFIFNPEERGFELKLYDSNFEVEEERQIWTEGPVLLVKYGLA